MVLQRISNQSQPMPLYSDITFDMREKIFFLKFQAKHWILKHERPNWNFLWIALKWNSIWIKIAFKLKLHFNCVNIPAPTRERTKRFQIFLLISRQFFCLIVLVFWGKNDVGNHFGVCRNFFVVFILLGFRSRNFEKFWGRRGTRARRNSKNRKFWDSIPSRDLFGSWKFSFSSTKIRMATKLFDGFKFGNSGKAGNFRKVWKSWRNSAAWTTLLVSEDRSVEPKIKVTLFPRIVHRLNFCFVVLRGFWSIRGFGLFETLNYFFNDCSSYSEI